jgi:hypothetical protein
VPESRSQGRDTVPRWKNYLLFASLPVVEMELCMSVLPRIC